MKRAYLAWAVSAGLLLGCGDERDAADLPHDEDPAEHACEHVEEAGLTLEAAADPADAPELLLGEEPVTVMLPEAGSGFRGYLRLRGPADALLFAGSEAVVNSLRAAESETDLLPEAAANELCPEDVPAHFDLELDDAEYLLELGPASIDSVWLMFMDAAGHAHDA